MDLFIWNQSYSVEINEIDQQHKVLVGLLNQLYKTMREGKGKEVISSVLTELVEYTNFHFSTEEAYFEKFNYSSAKRHSIAHEALRKKVYAFKARYDGGEEMISIDVLHFLKEWLTRHIMESDRKYIKLFKENGVL